MHNEELQLIAALMSLSQLHPELHPATQGLDNYQLSRGSTIATTFTSSYNQCASATAYYGGLTFNWAKYTGDCIVIKESWDVLKAYLVYNPYAMTGFPSC